MASDKIFSFQHKVKITEFKEKHFPLLTGWICDEELNFLWSGGKLPFPLDEAILTAHFENQDVHPYLFFLDETPVGYFELVKLEPGVYKICRVVVGSKNMRGMGIGKLIIENSIDIARRKFNAKVLQLAVFENNTSAVKCYTNIGFKTYKREENTRIFKNEFWALLYMKLSL